MAEPATRRSTPSRSRSGSLRDKIKQWEAGQHFAVEQNVPEEEEFEEEVFLRRSQSTQATSNNKVDNEFRTYSESPRSPGLRLSVVFEMDEEDDNDSEKNHDVGDGHDARDGPTELAFDGDEAEFISIELAQEAIEEVMSALKRMSNDSRKSLKITDFDEDDETPREEVGVIVGSLDLSPASDLNSSGGRSSVSSATSKEAPIDEVIENNPSKIVKAIRDKVMASNDATIRDDVPVLLDKLEKCLVKKSTTPAPMALPPPPPPPPPPQALTKASAAPRLASPTKGKSVITGIQLKKNEEGQVDNVELRVKGGKRPGGEDMMGQLQMLLKKRQNRASLQAKYQELEKS